MYEYKIEITRVIDGDTIVANIDLGMEVTLANQHIRLYGINTPETRTKDLEEKTQGLAAKAWLTARLEDRNDVVLKTHKDKQGSFSRYLGELIVDQSNINQEMLALGLAKEFK